MIRRYVVPALAVAIAMTAVARAFAQTFTPVARAFEASAPSASSERHHYTITARVRPFVLFWITRSGVGDAVVTRKRAPGEARYTLLIGSDPDRAPLHINRWGYIEEETRGVDARLIGLMTESDEESIEQAEANIRAQSARHRFKIIQGSADAEQARSRVSVIATPEDYTLRHLPIVLDLATRTSQNGTSRVVRLPAGARPGFLSALADAMRDEPPNPITYVYYGRIYELRRTRAQRIPNVHLGPTSYGPAVAADFVSTSTYDGDQTRFSITYGTQGAFAEVPLRVTYQPRWWMQIELTIDDATAAPALAAGVQP
jgi:hypothetical protein